jgi:guanine deaminase
MHDAYKTQQLAKRKLSPFKALYLATLGGAKALDLEDKIGNLQIGKEADFIVINKHATPFLQFRMEQCHTLFEELFVLVMLGKETCVSQTHIMGKAQL